MNNTGSSLNQGWFKSATFRSAVWIIGVVILIASFINGVLLKHNDFRNHYKLGVSFLQGNPYMILDGKSVFSNYPVGRLMINTALALFPYRVARGVCWAASIIALLFSLKLWHQMAQNRRAVSNSVAFAAGALTIGIGVRWVVRDLDDCGLHILLLCVLTIAGWAVMRNKTILSGFLLAFAATYKVMPILFFPFLLYKRRWREAVWMLLFIAVLNLLLPVMFLGWQMTLDANRVFITKSREVIEESRADPLANSVDPPRHTNRNLRAAMARYLQTYRPGHELFIPHPDDVSEDEKVPNDARSHPLFLQFLDLSIPTTNLVISIILSVFAVLLAILFRHKWGNHPPAADLAVEWPVVMALSAILSPLCWGQHLVLVIPALFVPMRTILNEKTGRWRSVVVWIIAFFVLIPQREIFGRDLWLIIHSYKPETVAVLLCIVLVLTLPEKRTIPSTS